MENNDCFVFYIIATEQDGTKKVYSFKHVIGLTCSYTYVTTDGDMINLSNYEDRTVHADSSSDGLGNVIHETKAHSHDGPGCYSTLGTKFYSYENSQCSWIGDTKSKCNSTDSKYHCKWLDAKPIDKWTQLYSGSIDFTKITTYSVQTGLAKTENWQNRIKIGELGAVFLFKNPGLVGKTIDLWCAAAGNTTTSINCALPAQGPTNPTQCYTGTPSQKSIFIDIPKIIYPDIKEKSLILTSILNYQEIFNLYAQAEVKVDSLCPGGRLVATY